MSNYRAYKEKALQNPKVKAEYDALQAEYDIIQAMIDARNMQHITQKELSERMDCSPQYVSKVLKGSEKLTLETISKLEECLKIDLIKSALTYVKGYEIEETPVRMIAEPDSPKYGGKKNK